jgi:hypothetical protein
MQQRGQGGEIIRAYFAQNIHGDVSQGRVIAAQQGDQALYGVDTADFSQSIFGRFLYTNIRTANALAQQVDAFSKPHVSCREGRAPEGVSIVAS